MIAHANPDHRSGHRSGITLTEILISIMIMGIGMVSLATLFPLGLLRLRDAARFSRSAYLVESAAADIAGRGLLSPTSMLDPDTLNVSFGLPRWYVSPGPNPYNPLIRDTPLYGGDWNLGAFDSASGLPFAYDPLWRFQTDWNSQTIWGSNFPRGVYLNPLGVNSPTGSNLRAPEARFASGIGFLRDDPDGLNNGVPSAHGLQRLTNFNIPMTNIGVTSALTAIMPQSQYVPSIFVSPEDVVWQNPTFQGRYPMAWNLLDPISQVATVDSTPSPLVPDLSVSTFSDGTLSFIPIEDWRYSWMFTGRMISSGTSAGTTFDGDIVIFENRPFALDAAANPPFPAQFQSMGVPAAQRVQAAGERVVEAVFGYTSSPVYVDNPNNILNGISANKSVLLRWPATQPDPEVRVGGWIADVTYERNNAVSATRFQAYTPLTTMSPSSPRGQRCYWYQVVKLNPPAAATGTLSFIGDNGVAYRYMIVNVATPLRAFTPLYLNPSDYVEPLHVNAALVSPHVIQVIPRTFTVN